MEELIQQRDKMEARAQQLRDYLCGPGQPGLKGGLDDSEGYPRADIDIIPILEARNELACLNTDYNNLMKKIEAELLAIHSRNRPADIITPTSLPATNELTNTQIALDLEPASAMNNDTQIPASTICEHNTTPVIGTVIDVLEDSQGFRAGIQIGDVVLKIGQSVPTTDNFVEFMQSLGAAVEASKNSPMEILVRRNNTEEKILTMIPEEVNGKVRLGFCISPAIHQ